MDYYSAIKRNKIGTFVDMCMDLESIVQSKLEREKQISYINVYMWNLEKWYRSYLESRNRDRCIE